jgi:hypothetical protein
MCPEPYYRAALSDSVSGGIFQSIDSTAAAAGDGSHRACDFLCPVSLIAAVG